MKRYREAAARVFPSRFLPFFSLPPRNSTVRKFGGHESFRTHARARGHRVDDQQREAGWRTFCSRICLRWHRATTGTSSAFRSSLQRDNIFVRWGDPIVTLSTHMDTVPPFFASNEDPEFIWGRGSCDAKGIIAAMIAAAEKLLAERTRQFRVVVPGRRRAQLRRRQSCCGGIRVAHAS